MATHYIGMSGIHGCLPNFRTDACEFASEAAASLADLHELGRNRARTLTRHRYLEMNLRRDGAEYAEIVECDCDHPKDHSEA